MNWQCKILPNSINQTFEQVNLADEFMQVFEAATPTNPMNDIEKQEYLLSIVKEKYNTKYTFGGYLEDRSILWKGFEQSGTMIHLGVDINNLTIGDPVTLPCDGKLVHILKDKSKMNGWGGRLIFRLTTPFNGASYLLYGHLDYSSWDNLAIGRKFKAGDVVGYIGDSTVNGGWFVHLHCQLIKNEMWWLYSDDLMDLDDLDGYLLEDVHHAEEYSADPTDLLFTSTPTTPQVKG